MSIYLPLGLPNKSSSLGLWEADRSIGKACYSLQLALLCFFFPLHFTKQEPLQLHQYTSHPVQINSKKIWIIQSPLLRGQTVNGEGPIHKQLWLPLLLCLTELPHWVTFAALHEKERKQLRGWALMANGTALAWFCQISFSAVAFFCCM